MDRDETFTTILTVVVLLALAMAGSYGTYRYGRFVEHRALYAALLMELDGAYGDGYTNGKTNGIKEGHAMAVKEFVEEEKEAGRY